MLKWWTVFSLGAVAGFAIAWLSAWTWLDRAVTPSLAFFGGFSVALVQVLIAVKVARWAQARAFRRALREAPDLTAEELNDFRRRWLETNT